MGLFPSCDTVEGLGRFPVLGDGPFSEEGMRIAMAELLEAFPEAVFTVSAEKRNVYKEGTQAHKMASSGIHIPGMVGSDDIEERPFYHLSATALGWTFSRAWYYWRADTVGGIPLKEAKAFNEKWGRQVRADGHAGGKDALVHFVNSYHVDTLEGLKTLAALIRVIHVMVYEGRSVVDERPQRTEEQAAKDRLWDLCKVFITKKQISCPEAVYQCDRVIESAPELIEGIATIVGFEKE